MVWGRQLNGYVYLQQNEQLGVEAQPQGLWVHVQEGTSESVMHHPRMHCYWWPLQTPWKLRTEIPSTDSLSDAHL